MADNDMTTPPGPWMDVKEPEFRCDICGRTDFENQHGLTMHKRLGHNPDRKPMGRKAGRPKGSGNKPKPPKPQPQPGIVLREVYTDGGPNGRILLTDQDGNWWVARKLDV